jgi:uncharacterized BrkB/YihY/UPF0761 family membrane protein
MMLSLFLSVTITALAQYWGPQADWASVVNFIVSFGVFFVLIMAIFRVLPDIELDWRDVALGALLTTILFVVGKSALSWYLARPGTASASGTAGALVILLLWIYYSAQILFLGAEFTKVYAHRYGSHAGKEAASAAEASLLPARPSAHPAPASGQMDAPGVLLICAGGALAVAWAFLRNRRGK